MTFAFQSLALAAACLCVIILAAAAVRLVALAWMSIDSDIQKMRRAGFYGRDRISRKTARRANREPDLDEVDFDE